MGSEAEKQWSYTPKLLLFSSPQAHKQSPERSGTLTPPLHASTTVPFRWEEEPGKPKPCTTLTIFSDLNDLAQKCLELPPRLLHDAKNTPALEGARFQSSSSFRMGSACYGSFRSGCRSPERVHLGTMVLSKRGTHKAKWFLGPWRRRASREVGGTGNSHVFPSSGDRDSECSTEEESNCATSVKITRIKRVGSFRSLLHSNFKFLITRIKRVGSFRSLLHSNFKFLATMQEGFRLSVPWSKREKKGGFVG